MTEKPPRPSTTDPNQHAPGVSRTLEENADESRRRYGSGPKDEKDRNKTPEREPEPESD